MTQLSICIATLNRAAFIGETLASIIGQLTDEVELLVVDGASDDGTDGVVAALFAGRSNCRYHRLPEKGGIDLDYCRTVGLAVGEFCWLLADDDLVKPGAVRRVLDELSDRLDLVLVNSEVANTDLSTTLVAKRLRIDSDCEFGPDNQAGLLALTGDLLSFIGTVVIRRTTWLSRQPDPYLGTEFIHVGIIFQQPLERSSKVLADPLVRIRYGNAQWSRRAFDIWMFKWPDLIWSFPHLPEGAKKKVVIREPFRRLRSLFIMKAMGCFTYSDYKMKLSDRSLGSMFRAMAVSLALFPDTLFNALLSVLLSIIGRAPSLQLDLRLSPFDYRQRWLRLKR